MLRDWLRMYAAGHVDHMDLSRELADLWWRKRGETFVRSALTLETSACEKQMALNLAVKLRFTARTQFQERQSWSSFSFIWLCCLFVFSYYLWEMLCFSSGRLDVASCTTQQGKMLLRCSCCNFKGATKGSLGVFVRDVRCMNKTKACLLLSITTWIKVCSGKVVALQQDIDYQPNPVNFMMGQELRVFFFF